MTGYGGVNAETETYNLNIEVKSLNSKYFDLSLRLSSVFSDQELLVRNLASKYLIRGKIQLSISYSNKANLLEQVTLNQELIEKYYHDLKQIASEVGASKKPLFQIAMTLPNVYKNTQQPYNEQEWAVIEANIVKALQMCDQFRIDEGKNLQKMLEECAAKIADYLNQIEKLDPERMVRLRERLHKQVADFVNSDKFDPNRFEQELIYYVEKLDINEEKVRLRSHLKYFAEVMPESDGGKKLNFIAQEIGREINTIGSKANDATIQRLVVMMKDELEKIKEQLSNVL